MIHDCENCSKQGNCEIEDDIHQAEKILEASGLKGLVDWIFESASTMSEQIANRLYCATVSVIKHRSDTLQEFTVAVIQVPKERFKSKEDKDKFAGCWMAMGQHVIQGMMSQAIEQVMELGSMMGIRVHHVTNEEVSGGSPELAASAAKHLH